MEPNQKNKRDAPSPVVAIDPGTERTGVAILRGDSGIVVAIAPPRPCEFIEVTIPIRDVEHER